jgi:hypothetical protein
VTDIVHSSHWRKKHWRNGLGNGRFRAHRDLAGHDVAQAAHLAQGVTGTPGSVIHKELRAAPRIFLELLFLSFFLPLQGKQCMIRVERGESPGSEVRARISP